MPVIRPPTYLRQRGTSPDGQGRLERGLLLSRAACAAALILLLLAPAVPAGAQSEIPDDNFNPVGDSSLGDSIGDDSDVGDTSGEGGEGSAGANERVEGTFQPGGQGSSRPGAAGGSGNQPAPAPPASLSRRTTTTTKKSTTTTKRAVGSQPAVAADDLAVPDAGLSPSPSPSPTPSLSPLTTPTPTPTAFFSGALDEGQKTSDEGGSLLPLVIAFLLALGIFFWVWNGRRRTRMRRGGHSLRR
jgi:hypothetical protein